jgi:predicted NACHT family NTPase
LQQILNKKAIDFTRYIDERTVNFTSREWIFEKINEWLEAKNASQFFVIIGEPGSGKTAIAGRLYQFSAGTTIPPVNLTRIKNGFLNGVHFCSSRDSTWINPRKFSESLTLQLVECFPGYAKALIEMSGQRQIQLNVQQNVQNANTVTALVIQNLNLGNVSPEESFIRLVREPLEVLYETNPEQQVIILVDGLDESLLSTDPKHCRISYQGSKFSSECQIDSDFPPAYRNLEKHTSQQICSRGGIPKFWRRPSLQ